MNTAEDKISARDEEIKNLICDRERLRNDIDRLEAECTRLHQLWHDAVEMVNVERKLADGFANSLMHEAGTGDVLPLSIAYDAWKTARNPSPQNETSPSVGATIVVATEEK